jgi:hypothetical protein
VLVLTGAALLLYGAMWVGTANPGGFVWVERLLHHPVVFGLTGSVLLIKASTGRTPGLVRSLVVAAAVLVSVAAVGLLVVLDMMGPMRGAGGAQVPAPAGAPYRALIREGSLMVDPVWVIWIRQDRGLLSREWRVGCLNGDDPADSYEGLTWVSASELRVRIGDGRQLPLRVVPSSGQPSGHIDTGVRC